MSKELKVRTAFVKKAYDAADADWKLRIQKEFPELFKESNLDCLQNMVKECFHANKAKYSFLSWNDGDIRVVNINDQQFYVVVKLPSGHNTEWTLSSFEFIHDFLEYLKDSQFDGKAFPYHSASATKEISKSIDWSVERYIPIYVLFTNRTKTIANPGQEFLTTSEEFVKEAYVAACKGWKSNIAAEFPKLFKVEKTYPLGTRLMIDILSSEEEEFMIAGIGGKAYAICIKDGRVWSSLAPMEIVNGRVSYTEVSSYIGYTPFHIL